MAEIQLTDQKENERRKLVRSMTVEDALEEVTRLRRHLFDLRIQKDRGEVRNVRQFARTRKDIAMLLQHITDLENADAGMLVEFENASDEDAEPENESVKDEEGVQE